MKKQLKFTFLFIIMSWSGAVLGQLNFGYQAQKMDTSINSSYSEVGPVLTPQGNRLYFMRINHPDNRYGQNDSQDIWYSDLENGQWSSAKRLPDHVNLSRYNSVYSATASGGLIINGIYTQKGTFIKRGLSEVETSGSDEFGTPKGIHIRKYHRKSDGRVASVHVNQAGTVMMISLSKLNKGKRNQLYVSKFKRRSWSKPRKLKKVNSFKSEEAPFLNQNATTLYFTSNNKESKGFDLYSSQIADVNEFRKWSEPVKLAGDFNSNTYDGFMVLDPKEEFAYFTSDRGSDHSDIYKLQVKELKEVVHFNGVVNNYKTGLPLKPGTPFKIRLVAQDSSVLNLQNYSANFDSSSFAFEVPYGAEYQLIATVTDFEELPQPVDLTKISSFQNFQQNALVKPIEIIDTIKIVDTLILKEVIKDTVIIKEKLPEMMRISGRVVGVNNGFEDVQLLLNDQVIDSARVSSSGSFDFKVPLMESYSIKASKPGYFPSEARDITPKDSTTRSRVNVIIELKKKPVVALLKASVKSRKDSSFLAQGIYDIWLDGSKLPEKQYTKSPSGFELDLPIGGKYFVMVKSQEFIEAHHNFDLTFAKEKESIEQDFYLVPLEVGATVQVENIYFDLGKSNLRSESFAELDLLTDIMNDHQDLFIEISGHTDNRGNAYLNKKLSGERALAVKNYLIAKGVDQDRMTHKGYGFDRPIAKNDTEANRSKNRRVEFTILAND